MAEHLAKVDVPRYLRDKRARKAARRSNRQWRTLEAMRAKQVAEREQFGERSKIIAMIAGVAPPSEKMRRARIRFTFPATFSVLDNPEPTLAALLELARRMKAHRLGIISLDLSKVKQYDLGANALLDVLVDELSTQARQTNRKLRWRGTYPTDPANRRFFQALGVIKRLKIEHEYPTQAEADRLVIFDERSKHYQRALRAKEADRKSRVTQAFADHLNKCLGQAGKQLTESARGRLCQYVGEIIDNAEEHAGEILDWTIQGYLDAHLDTLMCEIVIFNFGRTIAESLDRLAADAYTRQQIQKYLDLHQRGGLFRKGWRKEDLLTLMALQANVSSKNYSDTDTRGNGTVDLIQFFQRVHAECCQGASGDGGARMAILSGSSYVFFDGKYEMKPNSNGIGIIAFNADNDLRQRPDAKYVRQLEGVSFPGTLISIKFALSTAESTLVASPETGDEH